MQYYLSLNLEGKVSWRRLNKGQLPMLFSVLFFPVLVNKSIQYKDFNDGWLAIFIEFNKKPDPHGSGLSR